MLDRILGARKQALPTAEERREHPRVPNPGLEVNGIWADVHDVSLGGICLQVDAPLEPYRQCDMVLTDPGARSSRDFRAEVVWSRKGRAGFRWVELSEEQKQWLGERLEGWQATRPTVLLKK